MKKPRFGSSSSAPLAVAFALAAVCPPHLSAVQQATRQTQPSEHQHGAEAEREREEKSPPGPPSVRVQNGRLTVHAKNRRFRSIIADLARTTDVAFELDESVEDPRTTVDFDNLSIEEGLRRVLASYDSFFLYADRQDKPGVAATLSTIWVFARGRSTGVIPTTRAEWASTAELEKEVADPDPEVRGRAIEAIVERRGQRAEQIIQRALTDDNDDVRTRTLYAAISADVDLSPAMLKTLVETDRSRNVRFLALQQLEDHPEAKSIAERAQQDPDSHVRAEADRLLKGLAEAAKTPEQRAKERAERREQEEEREKARESERRRPPR
jgi:hypothetical protein